MFTIEVGPGSIKRLDDICFHATNALLTYLPRLLAAIASSGSMSDQSSFEYKAKMSVRYCLFCNTILLMPSISSQGGILPRDNVSLICSCCFHKGCLPQSSAAGDILPPLLLIAVCSQLCRELRNILYNSKGPNLAWS